MAANPMLSPVAAGFSVFDRDTERFDVIAAGHTLSAAGREIQIDVSDPEEGVWIEKRTKNGYERVAKARLLRSDYGMSIPPHQFLIQ